MSRRTGIYVAGPMRGIPAFNFPAFHEAQRRLEEYGYPNIGNPAEWDEDKGFDASQYEGTEDLAGIGFDLAAALKMDLDWIADNAFAVAVLPGWEKSKGVAAEVALAKALGLKVAPVEDFLFMPGDRVRIVHDEPYYWWDASDKQPADVNDGQVYDVAGGIDYDLDITVRRENGYEECVNVACVEKVHPEPPRSLVAELHEHLTAGMDERPAVSEIASMAGEVRIVSETGGEKGQKSARLGTVDPLALLVLAEVSGFGARKYAAFNYLKGYDWDLSYDALTRHLLAFWNGEDHDPESGLPHITHAAWHCLALTSFQKRGLGTDTRYKQEEAA